MKKVLFMLLMIVGVVYGQKVMLFDLSKYELISKEKGLESYKVGDIIFTTDIKYNSKEKLFEDGSKLAFERKDGFDDMTIYLKRDNDSNHDIENFIFSDGLGEQVRFRRNSSWVFIGDDAIEMTKKGIEFLKIVLKEKKMSLYINNKLVKSLPTSHMDGIKMIEYFKNSREEVYEFKIVAEN